MLVVHKKSSVLTKYAFWWFDGLFCDCFCSKKITVFLFICALSDYFMATNMLIGSQQYIFIPDVLDLWFIFMLEYLDAFIL